MADCRLECGTFVVSVGTEQSAKTMQVDLQEALGRWRAVHRDVDVKQYPGLFAEPVQPIRNTTEKSDNLATASMSATKGTDSTTDKAAGATAGLDGLMGHGRERYRDKVAELEERVIAAGVVGETSELDLSDSFIDDTEKSSVKWSRIVG